MCQDKFKKGWCSSYLAAHAVIIFFVTAFVLFDIKFWFVACLLSLSHFFIDGLKSWTEKKKINNKVIHGSDNELYIFLIDQLLHVVIIYFAARVLIKHGWECPEFLDKLNLKTLVFVLMLFVCGTPANILTRELLITFHIMKNGDKSVDEPQIGRIIGVIERCLIVFFMFVNQFAAIGFIITAKSILRFKDLTPPHNVSTKGKQKATVHMVTDNSEYVLIGTFMSISIAVICGFMIMIAGNPSMLTDEGLKEASTIFNTIFK